MTYLEALERARSRLLAVDPTDPPNYGLCDIVTSATRGKGGQVPHNIQMLLCDSTKSWPEYSGYKTFPVPPPHNSDLNASEAYLASFPGNNNDLQRYTGEYGEARLRLRDHWVKALTAAIDEIRNGSETGETP